MRVSPAEIAGAKACLFFDDPDAPIRERADAGVLVEQNQIADGERTRQQEVRTESGGDGVRQAFDKRLRERVKAIGGAEDTE